MVAGMAGICLAATESPGQANLPLYTDNLVNGFQNYSWATVNVANTSPVHSGSYSMSVTESTNYQALSIQYPAGLNTAPYSSLTFWINGGSTGGQQENVYGTLAGAGQAGTTSHKAQSACIPIVHTSARPRTMPTKAKLRASGPASSVI